MGVRKGIGQKIQNSNFGKERKSEKKCRKISAMKIRMKKIISQKSGSIGKAAKFYGL